MAVTLRLTVFILAQFSDHDPSGWNGSLLLCRGRKHLVVPASRRRFISPFVRCKKSLRDALRNSTRSGFAGLGNPFANLFFQNIERESSVPQDDIVKRADIEFRSEIFLSQRAKLLNFQLADLVGERLAGPCNIPIDFAG